MAVEISTADTQSMWGKTHIKPVLSAAVAILLLSAPAWSQQPKRPPPAKAEASQSRGEEAPLRQKIEQLEEQLVDMQVALGTLESLARSPSAAATGGGAAPAARSGQLGDIDQARVDSLETQVRALTNQLEQLAEQVRQLTGRRTDAGGSTSALAGREAARPEAGGFRQSDTGEGGGRVAANSGFGSTTVTPGSERDPIGRMLNTQPERTAPGNPPVAASGNPKELYETAYGYLLQQDYGAAEVAFEEFLRLYPQDRLAADAQYWLGESLYVQRRYKPAAQAFLKVVQSYQGSSKVPGSLLKLAMTLEQLGQKDCALFSELDSRHPNASADIKSKAKVVRQRVGC